MYLSGGLTLMLLITAVSVVFTSGALQEKYIINMVRTNSL